MEFLQQNWVTLLLAVLLLVVLFRGQIMLGLAGVKSVDPAGAVDLVNHHDGLVVDVREDREWQQGHVRDAKHIPVGQIGQRSGELPSDRPLVVMCRSGSRSATAAARLKKAGFEQVYNLNGGVMAWRNAGLPLEG
jgi:rhodanese-related sulfurtransferase